MNLDYHDILIMISQKFIDTQKFYKISAQHNTKHSWTLVTLGKPYDNAIKKEFLRFCKNSFSDNFIAALEDNLGCTVLIGDHSNHEARWLYDLIIDSNLLPISTSD